MSNSKFEMPYGKHKGQALGDIPASYLLWLCDVADHCPQEVKDYVNKEREHLKKEASEERWNR